MTKREELDIFLERADDFISGSYILADIKIVGLLKAVAQSDTLLAIFKNCLTDFDYAEAQKKYLVKSKYLSDDKGEFVLPPNSRELLAFVFNVLVDIDAKRIDFGAFLNKYFYEDGSYSSGYSAFINAMLKPFRNAVKTLMESVIEGRLQDPVEAFTEEEARRKTEAELAEKEFQREKELSSKAYGASVSALKKLLLADKQNIKKARLSEAVKGELTLAVDMLANVIESGDKDAVEYAFVAYKYCAKAHKILFFGRTGKVKKYLRDVTSEL